jgi:hypothetical protein
MRLQRMSQNVLPSLNVLPESAPLRVNGRQRRATRGLFPVMNVIYGTSTMDATGK